MLLDSDGTMEQQFLVSYWLFYLATLCGWSFDLFDVIYMLAFLAYESLKRTWHFFFFGH